jgi:CheY-like chemotaxis protein/HPt (histidine-containing phosphotransfer) domain-containing protein
MPQGTPAPQLRILLVEEQAAARDLVVVALGPLKCRVDSVATGRDALARSRQHRADLILLSATLPDTSGAALVGALRGLPGLDEVPIVAICPEHSTELRDACLAAGATAHLPRPLESDRLLRLLEQLIPRGSETPVAEPVLDLDHLRGFTEGDPQLERELSTLFLATAEMYLHGMQEALTSGRPWTSIAHALKGASANLGARRLSALALLAERSEPDRTQLEAIEHAVEEVRASFGPRVAG